MWNYTEVEAKPHANSHPNASSSSFKPQAEIGKANNQSPL